MLEGYGSFDLRMWIIVSDLKIIIGEVKDILHIRIEMKRWEWSWISRKLFVDGIELVVVDMCISRCMHEVTDLEITHLCHHMDKK